MITLKSYKLSLAMFLIAVSNLLLAQGNEVPLRNLSYEYFERQAVINDDAASKHLGLYPISRNAILSLVDSSYSKGIIEDQLDYLKVENDLISNGNIEAQKPILKYFYKYPGRLFSVATPDFDLEVNPVLYLRYGLPEQTLDPVFQNTRGINVRGEIDKKVYFQSQITENQASFPDHVYRRMRRDTFVQGNGFNKIYSSDIFNIRRGSDYLNATGRFGFNATPAINLSFGYDRNFIGSGFRSLFLSDFSNNYSSLKINTKVWKIQYQNIFAEFFNNGSFSNPTLTKQRKYFSGHYLKFNFNRNFHVGFFEGVVYDGDLGLQPALLNPIIFYRSVEGFAAQQGNAMIGADFRMNLAKKFSLYGQLILDEFKFSEVFGEEPGWWANKFGIQLGAKYFNALGIDNLDLLFEWNTVRPYTYGHRSKVTSYSHFNQPLAHPKGANFGEFILNAKYYLNRKWSLELVASYMQFGEDLGNSHFGGNILLPYDDREQDYNNTIGQGDSELDILLGHLVLSYQFKQNMFLDFEAFVRNQDSNVETRQIQSNYFSLGVRLNAARWRHYY